VCKIVEFWRASGVHDVEKLCVLDLLWRCRARPPCRSFRDTAGKSDEESPEPITGLEASQN
jgi:hypothetical protein